MENVIIFAMLLYISTHFSSALCFVDPAGRSYFGVVSTPIGHYSFQKCTNTYFIHSYPFGTMMHLAELLCFLLPLPSYIFHSQAVCSRFYGSCVIHELLFMSAITVLSNITPITAWVTSVHAAGLDGCTCLFSVIGKSIRCYHCRVGCNSECKETVDRARRIWFVSLR